jgi:uncharacterized protein YycO
VTRPLRNPKVGSFGLVKLSGITGKLITVGQVLDGDGLGKYDHAFVYIGERADGKNIVEAEPGGARLGNYKEYDDVTWSSWNLTDVQRAAIVAAAINLLGTPYSILDYVALGALHLHLPWFGLVKRRVESSRYLICSQLVDQAYQAAGVQLFKDNRWCGSVTPMDLSHTLEGPA